MKEDFDVWQRLVWQTQNETEQNSSIPMNFFILRMRDSRFCMEEYDLRELFKAKYKVLNGLFEERTKFVEQQIEKRENGVKFNQGENKMEVSPTDEEIKELAFRHTYFRIPFMSFKEIRCISYAPRIWSPYQQINWKEHSRYKTNDQINAILLELACRRCQTNKEVLAYSHRKKGWASPEFKLRDDVSVRFKTNFGFGSSSYFFLILKFRNIEVHSFSRWIYYRIVDKRELISCTRNFQYYDKDMQPTSPSAIKRLRLLESSDENHEQLVEMTWDDAWREAMTFCCEAMNQLFTDTTAFIGKYIIDECHKLVEGLEEVYGANEAESFKFVVNYSNSEKEFLQHKLIEIKGEKLSGALHFIQSILELKDFMFVDKLVQKIEVLNKAVLDKLAKALPQVQQDLNKWRDELKNVTCRYEQLLALKEPYNRTIEAIKTNMYKKHPFYTEDMLTSKSESLLKQQDPQYAALSNEFDVVEVRRNTLSSQLEVLEQIDSNVAKYMETIQTYFKEHRQKSQSLFS